MTTRDEREADDFVDWVRPHLPAMGLLAARLTSNGDRDDVVQEALVSAWSHYGQFDPARGTPRAWLLAIVANHARRTGRRRIHSAEVVEIASADPLVDHDVERAVRALPRRQRMAVELFYFLDLPVTEVAAVMACAEGTVKATLAQARAGLRRVLGEELQ